MLHVGHALALRAILIRFLGTQARQSEFSTEIYVVESDFRIKERVNNGLFRSRFCSQ